MNDRFRGRRSMKKKILACMIITLGILYLPEIHANASTVTIDEATFPDSCVRKFALIFQ
jgi:hypothetical protein